MRIKKQRLKRRKDGRYRCIYKGLYFYGHTEDEALNLRAEYIRREKTGQLDHESVTVQEFAKKWLPIAKPNIRSKDYSTLALFLEHLTQSCGGKELSEVMPSDIKAIYSRHFVGLSDGYIRRAKQLYIEFFNAAIADRLCDRNPAAEKSAQPHKGKVGSHRAITETERKWILTYCRDHRAFPAVMAMLYAGLRPPEAKALDIDEDIDQ